MTLALPHGFPPPERIVSGAAGGGGAPGVGEVIVPNEAAASALVGLTTGQTVFVLSEMARYRFDANSPLALRANEVLASASAGASPRLIRTSYSDPKWRLGISHVYIDPSNVTGVASNENQAIFDAPQAGAARAPLLTWQEFYRRWGNGETIRTNDLVNFTVTVHVISSQPAASAPANPGTIDAVMGVDTFLRVVGEAPTTVLGPVVLAAFTAQNPAVPAPGGTPCSINVVAQVWAAFLGKRIRRTSDGSVATVLADLGGGTARISQPQLTNEAIFALTPTNVNWAIGDNVVVEDLTTINPGDDWQIDDEGSPTFGLASQANVLDCAIMNPGAGLFPFTPRANNGTPWVFYQCGFDRSFSQSGASVLNGCSLRSTYGGAGAGKGGIYGGAIRPAGGIVEVFGASEALFNFGAIDFFTYIQGSGVLFRGGSCVAGAFSVWDAPVQANFNPGGHGVMVGGQPNLSAGGAVLALRSANPIFGTGSVGKGMRVAPGSRLSQYGALPNIAGAMGDLQLADSVVGWAWNPALALYQPAGGLALTWANVALALGLGGFGGSAHEPAKDAHVNQAAAT